MKCSEYVVPSNYGWEKYHYLMKDASTSTSDLNEALISSSDSLTQEVAPVELFLTEKRQTVESIGSVRIHLQNIRNQIFNINNFFRKNIG